MPALAPTRLSATVTWLGTVADRAVTLAADPVAEMDLRFEGPAGECHGGLTRPACSRVSAVYPAGTPIRNTRQLSVISAEELARAATEIGLDRIEPAWLGASIMLEGLPDFTRIPPGSRLQAPSGATIAVDMENRPCTYPGREVVAAHHPEAAKRLKGALSGRRGVTAWVEREGVVRLGDALRLFLPDQDAWAHLAEARRPAAG